MVELGVALTWGVRVLPIKLLSPCPATGAHSGPCGGYVIDHVIPLACGGPDAPNNMQWQTIAEGKGQGACYSAPRSLSTDAPATSPRIAATIGLTPPDRTTACARS